MASVLAYKTWGIKNRFVRICCNERTYFFDEDVDPRGKEQSHDGAK
jgi:hypothetical protein